MELRRPLDGKENVFKLVEPLPDGSTSTFDEHFADLAKKTSVRIDAVRAVWALNVWNVVAYGTTTIPETSKRVEWAYVWGGLTGDKGWLRLAPWENPDIVPDQRRLLEYGRVVADWWSTAPVE